MATLKATGSGKIISTIIALTIMRAPASGVAASKDTETARAAKVFSTHPATVDRIDKARLLLARFPERDEYTLSTSEFDVVKQKLLTIVNQDSPGKTDKAAPPTLKRKTGGDAGN